MLSLLRRVLTRSFLVRAAFVLAAFLTTLSLLYALENYRGRRAWAEYESAARARGQKLMIHDFVPPEIPDAENVAAAPIFQEIFRAHAAGEVYKGPFETRTNGGKNVPTASIANEQPFDLVECRDWFVEAGFLSDPTDDPARDILRALSRYDQPLADLQDALQRPSSRFPINWDDGIAAAFPHLQFFPRLSRVLGLRTVAQLASGDSAAARESVALGLRAYRVLEHEPVLITGLVRIAILAQIEAAIRDGMLRHAWKEEDLRAIQADFATLDLLNDLRFALDSERGGFNYITHQITKNPALFQGVDSSADGPSTPLQFRFYPEGWVQQSKVLANRYFDEQLATIQPGRLLAATNVEDHIKSLTQSAFDRWRYALFLLLMPAIDGVKTSYGLAAARAQHTMVACALERHRLAHGAYPDSLEKLTPDYLAAIPLDIMDGQLLRYQPIGEGKGYRLWSVGRDRQDQGGKAQPKTSDRDQPDWLWTVPEPAAE